MLNPIKSLFFQFYWWQRKHGQKGNEIYNTMGVITLTIEVYVFATFWLLNSLFLEDRLDIRIAYGILIFIMLPILYALLYKNKYKKIIIDKRYNTLAQTILSYVFVLGAVPWLMIVAKYF